jgi:hypothetical protein
MYRADKAGWYIWIMNEKSIKLRVSAEIGTVSAEFLIPEMSVGMMTLAQGAGAGMDHPFMVSLASSLAAAGVVTLRRCRYSFCKEPKMDLIESVCGNRQPQRW